MLLRASRVWRIHFVLHCARAQVALLNPGEIWTLFVINKIIDVIFFLDIILQFHLMVPVKTHFGVKLVANRALIAKRYLRGWFVIDVLSISQSRAGG